MSNGLIQKNAELGRFLFCERYTLQPVKNSLFIAEGQDLKRGAVVDVKGVLVGTNNSLMPYAVLENDCDTRAKGAFASVFVKGEFNIDKLFFADGLSKNDLDNIVYNGSGIGLVFKPYDYAADFSPSMVPEEGSFNPVTSDGLFKAIDEAKEDMQEKIDEVTLDPSAVALGNVHLLDEVTELPADGCILIDSETNGPGEMSKDTLLELTAQNALAGNVAPAFDPTRTSENPYKAGESVVYNGNAYTFKVDHYGDWVAGDVFTGMLHSGSNFVCSFVGHDMTAQRSELVSVDSNCLYEFELTDTDWPVTSLTSLAYKFSITGVKKDGTATDLVYYLRDTQIVSNLFSVFIPSDVVAIYFFFRGDTDCKVTASMRLKYSSAVRGVVANMSLGSYGSCLSTTGIITYNVIPTKGSKYVKLKIDAPLGENETYAFSYSFFTVGSGIIPADAPNALPVDKRLGNHEVLGNTTGELEVEIPKNAVGFGFGLFLQVNGVSVPAIRDPYYKGSVSYYLYEIPSKVEKLINQTDGAQLIELESGTFIDNYPTVKASSLYRIRNANIVPVTKYFKLPLISGYLYWIFCFDENLNVLGLVGWVKRADINNLYPGTKFVNFAIKDNLQAARNISGDLSYIQNLINNDDTLEVSRFVSFEEKYSPVSHYNSSGWKSRFNLIHTTDNHVDTAYKQTSKNLIETISVANYIASNIDAVIDTGDVTNGYNIASSLLESEFASAKDAFVKSQKPVLVSLGNHDGNDNSDPSQCLTPQQQWDWLYSALEGRFSDVHFGDKANLKAYSYLDVSRNGSTLRVIALDQLDSPSYPIKVLQHTAIYSQSQIDWLVNLLENTPANYGIVICNHFPFAPYRASGYSEEWPCLNDGTFAQGWQMIPEIIQAFSSRSTLNKTYVDANGYQDIEVDADFSSVPASSKFCFYMCGHTHSKNTFYVKQEGGIDYNQLMLVEDSSGLLGIALDKVWRNVNSPISNVFSVLSVDLVENCVYRTSFGAIQKFNEATAQRISKIPFTES